MKRFFLALGVALGLASGQPDPAIYARAMVEDDRLVANARVEEAFAPGARDLIEAGTSVALRFSVEIASAQGGAITVRETRILRYDLRSGLYEVAFEGGKRARLVDPQAARVLASSVSGLALCRAAEAAEGAHPVVRAEIGILDSKGEWHDAPVLWNYAAPQVVLDAIPRKAGGGR